MTDILTLKNKFRPVGVLEELMGHPGPLRVDAAT